MATTVGINVAVTSTGTQQVTVQLQGIGSAASSSANQVGMLDRALQGLAIGAIVDELSKMIDAWSNLEGMVRTATNSIAQANAVQERVFEIAQATRQPLDEVAKLYQKMAIQADALGLSQNQVLTITEELGQALVVQHTSAAQAAGALLQFSQALGTGKVRAQEWNSILTGLPVLAKAVAEQLGVATSQVKAMITAGKFTSADLAKAVLGAQAQLKEQFDQSAHTIQQSFTELRNATIKWVGEAAEAINTSNTLGNAMHLLATHFDEVAKSVIALATGWVVWVALTGGLAALIDGVTAAVWALNVALLANPLVAVVALIAAALVALYEFRDAIIVNQQEQLTLGDYIVGAWTLAKQAVQDFVEGFNKVTNIFQVFADDIAAAFGASLPKFGDFIKTVANLFIGFAVGTVNSIKDTWSVFPQYFVGIFIDAYNLAIQATTGFVNQMISAINVIGDKVDLHIDPVQLTQIKNQFAGVTKNVGDDFKAAFNTDYVGGFLDKLTEAARGVANVRKLAAHQGGGGDAGSMDAAGTAAQIPEKMKKTKDVVAEATNALRALLNTIAPAEAEWLNFAKAQDTLNNAVKYGIISQSDADRYLVLVRQHYQDILFPVDAYIRKLKEERDALQLDGDAQDSYRKVQQFVEEQKKRNYTVTDQQIEQMKQEIALNQQAANVAQQRAAIISKTVQPAKDFAYAMQAADQLQKNGTISAQQYADSVDDINKAFLDTQHTLSAGVGSGLIDVFKQAQDVAGAAKNVVTDAFKGMEDALVNFVTTGKLNFTDLVSSIMSDLARLYIRIIENQVLTSLFSSGTGMASAGGSALGSMGYKGFASGGYTGDGGSNDMAGIVHKGEVVVNAGVVAQPGMKDYLSAINRGAAPVSAVVQPVAVGGGGTVVNMTVVNNASDKVSVSSNKGTDENGNANLQIIIDSVETELAGRVGSGRGKLYKSIGNAYGLRSVPSRA